MTLFENEWIKYLPFMLVNRFLSRVRSSRWLSKRKKIWIEEALAGFLNIVVTKRRNGNNVTFSNLSSFLFFGTYFAFNGSWIIILMILLFAYQRKSKNGNNKNHQIFFLSCFVKNIFRIFAKICLKTTSILKQCRSTVRLNSKDGGKVRMHMKREIERRCAHL